MAESAKSEAAKSEAAAERVEDIVDKENKQGYRGTQVDKTPNENYTVAGVVAGKPTPETTDSE